jgi:hypothetical protein
VRQQATFEEDTRQILLESGGLDKRFYQGGKGAHLHPVRVQNDQILRPISTQMRKFSNHLRKFFRKVQRKRASFRLICASSARKWCKSGQKLAGNLQKCAGFEQKFEKVISL